jgi:hypothetical protein
MRCLQRISRRWLCYGGVEEGEGDGEVACHTDIFM